MAMAMKNFHTRLGFVSLGLGLLALLCAVGSVVVIYGVWFRGQILLTSGVRSMLFWATALSGLGLALGGTLVSFVANHPKKNPDARTAWLGFFAAQVALLVLTGIVFIVLRLGHSPVAPTG